eukprot:s6026_g1.t1
MSRSFYIPSEVGGRVHVLWHRIVQFHCDRVEPLPGAVPPLRQTLSGPLHCSGCVQPWLDSFLVGSGAFFGFSPVQIHMQFEVHTAVDLDRYYQLFDNPALDILFGVSEGSAHCLTFLDPDTVSIFGATCFAALIGVQDFREEQDATEHPDRVPDPPLAQFTPLPAEAAGGVEGINP